MLILRDWRDITVAYFPQFLSQRAWQQVTGLNRICIWNQQECERNSCAGKMAWRLEYRGGEGGEEWKAPRLTLKAELRGGRRQARLKERFRKDKGEEIKEGTQ